MRFAREGNSCQSVSIKWDVLYFDRSCLDIGGITEESICKIDIKIFVSIKDSLGANYAANVPITGKTDVNVVIYPLKMQ